MKLIKTIFILIATLAACVGVHAFFGFFLPDGLASVFGFGVGTAVGYVGIEFVISVWSRP